MRAFSSDGLAFLQDYDSVPMIIKAAEQTPFDVRFRVGGDSGFDYIVFDG